MWWKNTKLMIMIGVLLFVSDLLYHLYLYIHHCYVAYCILYCCISMWIPR